MGDPGPGKSPSVASVPVQIAGQAVGENKSRAAHTLLYVHLTLIASKGNSLDNINALTGNLGTALRTDK